MIVDHHQAGSIPVSGANAWACLLAEGCCPRTAATRVRIPSGPLTSLCARGRTVRHLIATQVHPGATPGERSIPAHRGQRSGDLAVLTRLPWRVRSSRPRPRDVLASVHGCDPGVRSLVRWFDSTRWHSLTQRPSGDPGRTFAPGKRERRVRVPRWAPLRPRRPAVKTPAFHPG